MAEDLLRRRSALASLYREGDHGAAPAVTLTEQRPAGMLQVSTWDDTASLAGVALPRPNRAAVTDAVTALWLGPRRFLLVGPDLAARFAGSHAALVDQGQARVVVRIDGARVREVLAKGSGADLARFARNDVALTLLGHVSVALHAVGADMIDVYGPRSYGAALWEWLTEAAEEYGYRVLPRNDR
jgi:sarcosine oxidase subunit gamma